MNNHFSNILNFLKQWENSGMKELTNGTKLVCHVPHIAPQAWLHYIYKGLSIEQIEEFEKKFPVAFPSEYKEFLKESNGINVFSDSLSIWGLRNSYERTGDGAIQPYDILALNNERPKGCPNTWLFFGSYSWDGTRLLFDLANGDGSNKVYRCARRSTQILQEWPSFWVWFDSEVERIGKLFDSNGIKYDKKISTAPNFLD